MASPKLSRVINNIAGVCPQVSLLGALAGPLHRVALGLAV